MAVLTPPLSPQARRAVQLSNYEAKRLRCPHVAPEHLLLGICNARPLLIADILQRARIDLARIRLQVQRLTRNDASVLVKDVVPKLPETEQLIYDACAQAREWRHGEIGVEHLLLMILQDRASVAAIALANLHVDLSDLCDELRRRVSATGGASMEEALPIASTVPGSRRVLVYVRRNQSLFARLRSLLGRM